MFTGYTYKRNRLLFHLGPRFGFVPFGYDQSMGANSLESRNSSFFTLLLQSKISYQFHRQFFLGLQAGVGVLAWTGLSEPNIFIEEGLEQNGPLIFALYETGFQLGFHLHPNIDVLLTPIAVTISPRHNALIPSIDSLTSYQTFVGVGVRF